MQQDAILQCETSTKFTREARPRRVGPKRRGRAHDSRSRFVDMDDQWTFQCEIQKRHPLRDETSTDETTPKPDRPRPHLGRNRVLAYGPVTFPHSGVSRVSASVRLVIQGQSARRVTSRVRQCHLLIKNLGDFSHPYTLKIHSRNIPFIHIKIHGVRTCVPVPGYIPDPPYTRVRPAPTSTCI
jgi:hypothetical protein